MVYPVDPGIRVTAVFKQVSTVGNWKTCGHHTGVDFACQTGDPVYAVVEGDVRYRSYGPAFGLTVAVSPDGPGEWQYSHLSRAVPNGKRVKPGDIVGWAGTSGGVAPHLHLEWHPNHKNVWGCGIQADPLAEIRRLNRDAKPEWRFPKGHKIYLSKLVYGGHEHNDDGVSDSIVALQEMLNHDRLNGGQTLPLVGKYGPETDEEVRLCQKQHGYGSDAKGESNVGPQQAAHLLKVSGAPYKVVDDRPKGEGDPDSLRVTTFNWPKRYEDGGDDADLNLWNALASEADVIALQEAWWVYNRILSKKVQGWSFATAKTSNGENAAQILCWRDSRLESVGSGSTMISPATRVQDDAAGPNPHREKHIVWADLRDKETDELHYFGVAHFVPSKHLGGEALALWKRQRDACIEWIDRQGPRCVLLGDFNCRLNDPDAAPFRAVAQVHSVASHGERAIDWVVVKDAAEATVTDLRSTGNKGQSDHRPVSATVAWTKTVVEIDGLVGIDIASYQDGIDLSAVPADFVVVKATEGKSYVSPSMGAQYRGAKDAGRLLGLYHFARPDNNEPEDEAEWFASKASDVLAIGEAVLVLDWEVQPLDDVAWAKRWLDRVEDLTGVRPIIYMSESVTKIADWSSLDTPLWVAKYRDSDPDHGYGMGNAGPEPAVTWPGGWTIWQWTSSGVLDGWGGNLDLNLARLTRDEWAALANPTKTVEEDVVTRKEYEDLLARVEILEGMSVAVREAIEEYV